MSETTSNNNSEQTTDTSKLDSEIINKENDIQILKRKYNFGPSKQIIPPAAQKIIVVLSLIFSIILVWGFIISPMVFEFKAIEQSDKVDTRNNASTSLQGFIESLLFLNFTINIDCPESYVYSPEVKSCLGTCKSWHPCGSTCKVVQQVLLSIIDIAGIILCILTLITWPFIPKVWRFPHGSMLIVVIFTFIVIITLSIGDIPGPKYFYCGNSNVDINSVGDEYQIRLRVLGSILHFSTMSIFIWIIITVLNILLFISFPFTLPKSFKAKAIIFMIELIIALFIPSIFIILILSFNQNFEYNFLGDVPEIEKYGNLIGGAWFEYISIGIIISIIFCILSKLRIHSINYRKVVGAPIKLSTFELRFLIFGIISSILLFIYLITRTWYNYQFFEYSGKILDSFACVTLYSPINITFSFIPPINGIVPSVSNYTYTYLHPSVWKNGELCENPTPYQNVFPGELMVFINVISRAYWLLIFIVAIMEANIKVWIGFVKKIYYKLKGIYPPILLE